jgi:exodeoxyribonuclease VII large subunit
MFWVVADISSHNYYPNKEHHYFELVEKSAVDTGIIAKMSAVSWKAGSLRIKAFEKTTGQKFRTGMQLLLQVVVEFHAVYGLKAVLVDVDAGFTLGQLEQERQRTLERLVKECPAYVRLSGDTYITRNRELPYPRVIQRIAIVGSGASAGFQDFMHTLRNNSFGYQFDTITFFTTIQGSANAEQLAQKIAETSKSRELFDAVVIIRGGGADTDFLLFDQFEVCRQIASLPVPVITGIGHQKNETISDLMARTSTKTPTMAAEFIIAHNRQFEEQITGLQKSIIIRSQQFLGKETAQLSQLKTGIAIKARQELQSCHQSLQQSIQQISHSGERYFSGRRDGLSRLSMVVTQGTRPCWPGRNNRWFILKTGYSLAAVTCWPG